MGGEPGRFTKPSLLWVGSLRGFGWGITKVFEDLLKCSLEWCWWWTYNFTAASYIQTVCYVLKHTVSVWRRDPIYESKKKHDHLRNLHWALEKTIKLLLLVPPTMWKERFLLDLRAFDALKTFKKYSPTWWFQIVMNLMVQSTKNHLKTTTPSSPPTWHFIIDLKLLETSLRLREILGVMGYVARLCSRSQGFSKAAKKKTDSLVWCWSQT